MKLISVKNIGLTIHRKVILDDISFDVCRGELLSILGPNGSGKSTLASMILNDFSPSNGEIKYIPDRKKVFQSIGVVYDNQVIFPYLKVREYIDYFISVYNKSFEEIEPCLAVFDVKKIFNTQILKLSQGEKMKLAIFLAIFHNPKLLIMDEPFSGIDPTIIHKIIAVMKNSAETIIMTSQNWDMAANISDKIIFLKEGKMINSAFSPKEYKEMLPADKKIVVSKNGTIANNLNRFDSYYVDGNEIAVFCTDNNVLDKIKSYTSNFSVLETELKDLYLYLTYNKL